MSDDKLPLLSWQPKAQMIPFPGNKRIGKARHVADVFLSKSGKAQKNYWHGTAQRYVDALIKVGVSKSQAEKSLDDFRDAVQREVDLITLQEQKQR